jgi:hypothetical protein
MIANNQTIKIDHDQIDFAAAQRDKMPDKRMRTLLDELLPPQCREEQMFSSPKQEKPALRTFSQNAVLDTLDDLREVGLGETVMVAPSAGAEQRRPALGRGLAISETTDKPSAGAAPARLASTEKTSLAA